MADVVQTPPVPQTPDAVQTPQVPDAEYEAFMGTCMQTKLATMPDMSVRRTACQLEWDAAHPVAPFLDMARPGSSETSRQPKP